VFPVAAAPQPDPAITERYWALHEHMREEFLADLEEYLQLQRMVEEKRGGPISHQHSEKAARITNIIARLSVRGQACP
jgi:hypothetical protein